MHHLKLLAAILALLAAGSNAEPQKANPGFGSDVRVIRGSSQHWEPGPAKGISVAVLWGNPLKGEAGGELLKFDKGFAIPAHTHPYSERAVILSGPFVVKQPGHGEERLDQGSFLIIPAGVEHQTRCEAGSRCEVYNEIIPR
jgi:quercetin dioxygenase-like cupin family protein